MSSLLPRTSWSIDYAPAIKMVKGDRETIIIAVDDCSKLVILGVIPSLNSQAVSQWFTERILGPYGAPDLVRTDNGREFQGKFTELLLNLGVEHRLTRTHSPWTNGRAERTVRTVKSMIRWFVANNPNLDWRELVPYISHATNQSISRSTGFSPFEIFYGE